MPANQGTVLHTSTEKKKLPLGWCTVLQTGACYSEDFTVRTRD